MHYGGSWATARPSIACLPILKFVFRNIPTVDSESRYWFTAAFTRLYTTNAQKNNVRLPTWTPVQCSVDRNIPNSYSTQNSARATTRLIPMKIRSFQEHQGNGAHDFQVALRSFPWCSSHRDETLAGIWRQSRTSSLVKFDSDKQNFTKINTSSQFNTTNTRQIKNKLQWSEPAKSNL